MKSRIISAFSRYTAVIKSRQPGFSRRAKRAMYKRKRNKPWKYWYFEPTISTIISSECQWASTVVYCIVCDKSLVDAWIN